MESLCDPLSDSVAVLFLICWGNCPTLMASGSSLELPRIFHEKDVVVPLKDLVVVLIFFWGEDGRLLTHGLHLMFIPTSA